MARKKRSAPEDLAELDGVMELQETGILVPILHMDGETSLGFSIRIAGPDSQRASEARELMQKELIARESTEPLSSSERFAQGTLYLARITMGWEPKIVMDKKELEYSEDAAQKLYTRFRFIREQVDSRAGRRIDFLEASETSSSGASETTSSEESPDTPPQEQEPGSSSGA